MKALLLSLTAFFVVSSLTVWAQSSTPDEFIAAFRTAVQEKDPEKLKALTYSVGMNDYDQKEVVDHLDAIFNDKEISEITLEPLPLDYKLKAIVNGKKLEPTYLPTGLIKIQYKPIAVGNTTTKSFSLRPYAIIDGHYFLVPIKSTDVPVQIYSLGPGSDSPNNTYRIVVEKEGEPGSEVLVYGIVKASTGKVTWTIPCSYKMGDGNDDWALQNAQGAEIYWNKDGSHFVLDEANHNFIGSAILGTIIESSTSITTHTFVPGDLHMRGLARWRIRVDKGWIDLSKISLEITGINDSTGTEPGASITQNFTCEVADASHYQFTKTP